MSRFEIYTLGENDGKKQFGDSFISMYDVLKYIAEHHAEHVLTTGDDDVEYMVRDENGNIFVWLHTYVCGNLYMVYGRTMDISYVIDFYGSMLNKASYTWLYNKTPVIMSHTIHDDDDYNDWEES